MPLLEIENLQVSYGQIKALHGVSLEVAENSIVAVLGANGAGKSTTLRAVSGIIKSSGRISFDSKRIDGRPTEATVQMGIAHVPEGRGLFPQLSVMENLRMGAYVRKDKAGIDSDLKRVFGYFPRLEERRNQLAVTLSGGEQQMLALARGLMLRPRLLLLDEPSLGLAPLITREIFEIVKSINKDEGVTVLVVEQNASIALSVSQTAYVLETGHVAVSGKSEQLLKDEAVRKSYLGY